MATLEERTKTKLRESGLDTQMRTMGIEILPNGSAKAYGIVDERAGFLIPYFDLRGKRVNPKLFCRIRFFASEEDQAEGPKYMQTPNTLPLAYFPPTLKVGWEAVLDDPMSPIFITEGELKAACASHLGIPTIGLGGVWNFTAKPQGRALLASLHELSWDRRPVTIVYDSDLATNQHVFFARSVLAQTLQSLGAICNTVVLPTFGGHKIGLDDYLVVEGKDAFMELPVDQLGAGDMLWRINEHWALIWGSPLMVAEFDKAGVFLRFLNARDFTEAMREHTYMHHTSMNRETKRNPADDWMEWKYRRSYSGVDYVPGADQRLPDDKLNLWSGWPHTPKRGSVALWRELLNYVFERNAAHIKWFEQWAAYPIQHPGAKLYTAPYLWSPAKGVGKTLIGESLRRVYGSHNSYALDGSSIEQDFNEWATKQFILIDELGTDKKRVTGSVMRYLTTAHNLRINQKYRAAYEVKNRINFMICSNYPDSIQIDRDERRYFVHQITVGPKPQAFYERYHRWMMEKEDGPRALMYHLQHVDLRGFGPRSHAPTTHDLEHSIKVSNSDFEAWLTDITDDFPAWRVAHEAPASDLWTAAQLVGLYGDNRVTTNGAARMLSKLGFPKVGNSQGKVRTKEYGVIAVYALHNTEQWKRAKHLACRDHYLHYFPKR